VISTARVYQLESQTKRFELIRSYDAASENYESIRGSEFCRGLSSGAPSGLSIYHVGFTVLQGSD
jgi:hypothetical protein